LLETGESRLGAIEDRIFVALKWYNRSNSINVSDETALLHLAIAFESLLSLEQAPQITQRFKESVRLLVGPVPKLESWADQFYDARSRIVHEGSGTDLVFLLCVQVVNLVHNTDHCFLRKKHFSHLLECCRCRSRNGE